MIALPEFFAFSMPWIFDLMVFFSTVKAAKKLKGCLCCAPDEGDDEDDENEDGDSLKPKKDGVNSAAGVLSATIGRSKYVDGKSRFAFDPTLFGK